MTLPDRLEQVGIVVGSVILVMLPASLLGAVIYGFEPDPLGTLLLWLAPGLVVGLLLVAGRLPVTYHQVWAFSLSSWVLALAFWTTVGLSIPPADPGLAVALWLVAVVLGGIVAWVRPIRAVRRRCPSSA